MDTNKIILGDSLKILKDMPAESIDCVITSPPYWALRDYGNTGQLGLEATPDEYILKLCDVFDEVKRVLKPVGTCFVNLGDTYFGGGRNKGNSKPHPKGVRGLTNLGDAVPGPKGQDKSLAQIHSRFAIEMAKRGWILRNEIIWHKPNAMPASVKDRFTVDFEKIFFFAKSTRYFFNQQYEPSKDAEDDIRRTMRARDYKRERQGGNALFNRTNFNEEVVRERMMKGRNMRAVWSISTHGRGDHRRSRNQK